jgi:hypothetical protein
VRLTGGVEFEQGQFASIVHFDGFFGVHAGTGDEFEAVGQVDEANFAIVGVYAFSHGEILGSGATAALAHPEYFSLN